MASNWFISQDGKTYGPLTSPRLKELASDGRISSNALVANTAEGPWHPITRVKGLQIEEAMREPPPTPMPSQPPAPDLETTQKSNTATESLVWTGRPSQITNLWTFIICGLLFWLIVPIFIALWRWLVVYCVKYEVTSQRFKQTLGVLSRRTDELELYRVKDISLTQTLFERIFGLATLYLRTSDASSPNLWIVSIPAAQARELREQLRTLIEELRDRKRVREVDFN